MKKELRKAIFEGIKESDLRGYKWTVKDDKLHWSYGEVFSFDYKQDEDTGFLIVRAEQYGKKMVGLMIGNKMYHDCSSLEDAYRIATAATIKKANHIY